MSWNPTHVQLTVLRGRNLLTKGKGGMKLTDVFVSIVLGKEKFQTSTIKNALNPEWFEQCDLSISGMDQDITVTVMHRGLLSDDFIGYAAIPLSDFKVFDRPKSQWVKLRGKPHKPPDSKNRGELEVKLTFQVKNKAQEEAGATLKKLSSNSLKSIASAVGLKVGEKFKRSRSFRESQNSLQQTSDKRRNSSAFTSEGGRIHANNLPSSVTIDGSTNLKGAARSASVDGANFPAVDIPPPQWDDLSVAENIMHRSRSMVLDRQREQDQSPAEVDIGSSRYNRPGNRQSLPPSYWGTQTLPHPRGKRYSMDNESGVAVVTKSADDLDTPVSSQPGYLESMFRKEREVYKSMQKDKSDSSDDEAVTKNRRSNRKSAKEYISDERHSSDSDSEGGAKEIALPLVKRKSESKSRSGIRPRSDSKDSNSSHVSKSDVLVEPPPLSRNNSSEGKTLTETSFPESSTDPVYHNGKDDDASSGSTIEPQETADNDLVNGEEEDSGKSDLNRRKITPKQSFSFDNSPEKPDGVRRRAKRDRLRQLYKQGGRRYTVQGLPRRHNDDSLADLRPQFSRGFTIIPDDLIAVYKNMTKEELIHLVITHKAQLIRKDQYVKDMEDYIDSMLVRVMETNPRLLQHKNRFK
ncbi:rab11 family-interacting protein 2-like isoform X1 [Mizuhopecten yessoensis]|uniref:Rab11 family-interacting protein 1 n=1 Tax=Mizuhopecten yessoensis TaxID=6573 RepID=A0A210R740_MIZYE|nr:rab11 family-interacting protein 2-like isoform X1 [Mizuhopecten yessoensis]OWF56758.1 Rab11 family-interacting protein 1 [Mizuhopecten yessoensis]